MATELLPEDCGKIEPFIAVSKQSPKVADRD